MQSDGRVRRWARIPDVENRALRNILLEDGRTENIIFFLFAVGAIWFEPVPNSEFEENENQQLMNIWLSSHVKSPMDRL